MLQGIDVNEKVEYSLKADTENPTIFLLGNFTNRDKLKLFANAVDKDGQLDISKLQDKLFDIVKVGIKGVKNLGGKDYDVITDDVLDMLSVNAIVELGQKVLEINFASEEERKN